MENVEIVRRLMPSGIDYVELFREVEPGGPTLLERTFNLEPLADDLEVRFVPGVLETPDGAFSGFEGLLAGWRPWLEPWSSFNVEVQEIVDAGDDVLVLAQVRSRTARGDVLVETTPAVIWTLAGGKVVRIAFYLDRDEALNAAGVDVTLPAQSDLEASE